MYPSNFNRCQRAWQSVLSALAFFALALVGAWPTRVCAQVPVAAKGATEAKALVTEWVVAVTINGVTVTPGAIMLRDATGQFYASTQDLALWRLVIPAKVVPLAGFEGGYFAVTAIPGLSASFSARSGLLAITLAPESFIASRFAFEPPTANAPVRPGFGAYFNYDLSVASAAGTRSFGGLASLVVFSPFGALAHNVLADDSTGRFASTRLSTTFSTDFPSRLESLHIGDAITVPGAWGSALRIGGVQFGTDFATRPGFVTIPLQTVGGQAALPSVVDVFVNNALTTQRDVPAGPFAITEMPVVSGNGLITLVVRDLLGREQVITQTFSSSGSLLRSGLSTSSIEAGYLRKNYAVASNDYGKPVASATFRHGFTDTFTAEAHAEAQAGTANAGLFAAVLLGQAGTLLATAAGSTAGLKVGSLVGLGFEHRGTGLALAAHAERRSAAFTPVGIDASALASGPRRTLDVSAGRSMGAAGSLALAYIGRELQNGTRFFVVSGTYSVNVLRHVFVVMTVQRSLLAPRGDQINLSLSTPIGPSTNASASRQSSRGDAGSRGETFATVQRSPPAGESVGGYVQLSDLGNARAQGIWQASKATVVADAEHQGHQNNVRLGAQGGLGLAGGTLFASRTIADSFAIVQTPAAPNTRVYANNQLVGRTDASGELVIPAIRPYEQNDLALEQLDLGLDTQFKALRLDVVPYRMSGVIVRFPITRWRAATLRVVLADGSPLPVQTRLQIGTSPDRVPVGAEGAVYLAGLEAKSTVTARWGEQSCSFVVMYPAGVDPLPDLGEAQCLAEKSR